MSDHEPMEPVLLERRMSRSGLVFGSFGHGAPVAPSEPSLVDGIAGDMESIPGLGHAISAGVSVGERAHDIPGDVADTFTSLGESVVSSMTTAITTSVGDGMAVAEGGVEKVSSMNW